MKASACAAVMAMLATDPVGSIRWTPDRAQWKPGPAGTGGADVWVLEGDPTKPELFTIRIRVPPGFELGPHTHPRSERVTVLEGAVQVAFAPQFDARTRLPRGSFYVNPPGAVHVLGSKEGAVLQLTTQGPWEIQRAATGR